jgi:UDP-GlcNAc:undecaprenyl-phosphate GlcNAc-1-phosphate transferase
MTTFEHPGALQMTGLVLVTVLSFILSIIAVAVVLKISLKRSWFDRIDERKIHNGNVPRLGGIGFASVYILAAVCITLFYPEFSPGLRFCIPIAGLVIILVSGVIDDFRPLSPGVKIIFHSIGALSVVLCGYTFSKPFFIQSGVLSSLGWAALPFTFIWIIGITNAVNLIDGVDGLAGGLSVLIALSYGAAFFLLNGLGPGLLFCLCLAAVLLGFLVFNAPLPKARIFMGDGGAYFLGFILALLPLIFQKGTANTLPMFYAGALVLIPVFDTIAAIWRRLRDHRRIDNPDRAQTHHKLMNLGLTDRQIDLVLYGLQLFLGVMVIVSIRTKGVLSLALLAAAYVGAAGFFAMIHIMNRSRLKKEIREETRTKQSA